MQCSIAPYLFYGSASDWSRTRTTTVNRFESVRSTELTSPQLQGHLNPHIADPQRAMNDILAVGTAEANLAVEAINTLRPEVGNNDTKIHP